MEMNLTDLDREIFENELNAFLPKTIFDVHTHIWSEKHVGNCIEQYGLRKEVDQDRLKHIYSTLVPNRNVYFTFLGNPIKGIDSNGHNRWLAEQAAKDPQSNAFMLTTPEMTADYLANEIDTYGFKGFKPYRIFAQDMNEARIGSYLPENQMEVADEKGLCVTLHLDRRQGIADNKNQEDLAFYTRKYPRIKWILAHCARSFNSCFLENAIQFLKDLPNIYYDTAAVCDLYSHILLLKHEDIKRILYGSDLLAASGIRGNYISYGKAWEYYPPNLDLKHCIPDGTFVIYEQLRAQKRAAETVGLSHQDIDDIFYNNAVNLF